jgi:penicillin-binding protein 1A
MVSMLREAINSGTAVRAKAFAAKYPVAGKTGTTNDFSDAWFIGFSPSITCGVWVGFDDHRALGPKEEGARVALPIWMDFMSEALKTRPVEDFPQSPLLTNPDQVKEILASAGTQTLLAEHGASAGSGASAQRPPAAATAPAPAVAPSHPGPAVTPAVSHRGSIGYSQGVSIREPAKEPVVAAPEAVSSPEVKPAKADLPQASNPALPSLTLPAVTGDGQPGIASPPLPDAPPPPAPEKSGVTGALRHAKRGLRRIGEKIIHP